jgi:hypothetical protein
MKKILILWKLLLIFSVAYSQNCGTERWAVKLLIDPDTTSIDLWWKVQLMQLKKNNLKNKYMRTIVAWFIVVLEIALLLTFTHHYNDTISLIATIAAWLAAAGLAYESFKR